MPKKIPAEVEFLLKSLPIEVLEQVYHLSLDEKNMHALQILLNVLSNRERDTILSIAGAPKTQDEMIANAMSQQFSRGRISANVLVFTAIREAEKYVDTKIEEGKSRGK